jgi:hypothetical protein
MSDDTRPDPDVCPSCKVHYTQPCEDGCDCESCRYHAHIAALVRLDIDAGEEGRSYEDSVDSGGPGSDCVVLERDRW